MVVKIKRDDVKRVKIQGKQNKKPTSIGLLESLMIKEIHFKTIMRNQLTLVTMGII